MAVKILTGEGFKVEHRNIKRPDVGAVINVEAIDQQGARWHFDVSGAFKTKRPGLLRTDTMWKSLGRANVLSAVGVKPLILLTTNLPSATSTGGKALRAAHHTYFDAIEMVTSEGRARLRAYATGDHARPLPGFLTAKDVFGPSLKTGGALGAMYELPLAKVGDPLGRLHEDYQIKGLDHCLKVVVPSKSRTGTDLDPRRIAETVRRIESLLHASGGGCTTQTAQGSWTDPVAGVVHEQVRVLETYAARPFDESVVRPIVEMLLEELDQEVAALTLNDKMLHFPR